MKTGTTIALITLFVCAFYGFAVAAEQEGSTPKEWDIRIIPYAWLMSTDGEVSAGGLTQPFEADFSDIVDNLNIALMLRFEASKGKWGFISDVIYADLEREFETPVVAVSVNPTLLIADLDVSYLLFESDHEVSQGPVWSFDLIGGIRFWDAEAELTVGPMSVSADKQWVEPVIGGRVRVQTSEKWGFGLRGDIGGGELDLDKQFTWGFVLTADYRISESISLDFGYRFMSIDIETGSGLSHLKLDTDLHGPGLALTFHF